jgi:LysR family glycine cleavage system transcriptional activator
MSLSHTRIAQPSLLSVRAFEAAGRLNSFTLAAQELGLTQSAISRHVQSIEERFGKALFQRRGRHIALTDAGALYLREISPGLDRIREANVRMVQEGRLDQRVTISMLPSVAAMWLSPRLHEFSEANPEIDLRIHASRAMVDFELDQVDLAIRYGRGTWPDCRAELLIEETLTPVCSPEFARRYKLDDAPNNLLHAPLLVDDIPDGWDEWLRSAQLKASEARFGAAFDEGSALYGAAMAGAGVALGRGLLIRQHVSEGRLVAPFSLAIPASYSYWLVRPSRALPSSASLALARWLRSMS